MEINIHFWNKNKLHKTEYCQILKDHGVDGISLWSKFDNSFLRVIKFNNLKCYTLPPFVLNNKKVLIPPLKNYKGEISTGQCSFFYNSKWSKFCLESLQPVTNLIDGVIITDCLWYLMIGYDSKDKDVLYINDEKTKEYVKEKLDYDIPQTISNIKNTDMWKKNIQVSLFKLYFEKYIPIMDWCVENKKEIILPIHLRRHVAADFTNIYLKDFYEEIIQKYKPKIVAMKPFINKEEKKWLLQMKQKYRIKILGGTEGAVGMLNGNGKLLKDIGFDGTISDEHHFFNNRHPTFKQIRYIIKGLKDE